MEVQRVLNLLRRWWPALVVGTLLAAGASYAVSKAQPKVYQATAVLQVNQGLPTSGGGTDFNELQAEAWLAAQNAQEIKTTRIAQDALTSVQQQLLHHIDVGTLLKNTTATAAPQSTLINVAVRASNAHDAQLLAQAIADDFVGISQQQRTGGITSYINTLNKNINTYTAELGRANYQNQQLLQTPNISAQQHAQITTLIGQISILQNAITEFETRRSLAEAQLQSPGATTSVYQPSVAAVDPLAPRTAVNVVVAAVLVLLALLGIAVLTDALDTRPRSAAEVAAALGLPLAGTVGLALTALQDPASAAADEYRLLRTTLGLGTDPDYPATPRVLAITGTAADSGATTVAANLAAVTARTGARVIVVDADLRHPTLHTFFGLPDGAGLSTALRDGDDSTALLQGTAVPGLQVLTTGPTTTAAVAIDLLDSTRMQTVLAELRAMADLVVVNTSAAMLPDTAALTRLADGTLLVARLHSWNKTTLTVAADRLRLAGARLEGVVVTRFVGAANRGLRLPVPTPGVVEREQSAPAVTEREQSARTSPRPAK